MTDLRTLAQAVVDARAAWLAVADAAPSRARAVDSDEWRAMLTAEGNLSALARGRVVHSVSLLLAALDAERAQGYARAMGEVDSLLQDPTICPACGHDKTAAAEKEHGAAGTGAPRCDAGPDAEGPRRALLGHGLQVASAAAPAATRSRPGASQPRRWPAGPRRVLAG